MYNDNRSYIYNKAFARWFDNNDPSPKHTTRTGGLFPTGVRQENTRVVAHFDLIRMWAEERGLYAKGDPKTQALKLVEEVGETCRAILKNNKEDVIDGIGDCVVVLTNLAELIDTPIEECIDRAWNEIKNRTGKMSNGTFKKD
jgi:NTP pyrophosphatase (non-canonical NTP hydrolase)